MSKQAEYDRREAARIAECRDELLAKAREIDRATAREAKKNGK